MPLPAAPAAAREAGPEAPGSVASQEGPGRLRRSRGGRRRALGLRPRRDPRRDARQVDRHLARADARYRPRASPHRRRGRARRTRRRRHRRGDRAAAARHGGPSHHPALRGACGRRRREGLASHGRRRTRTRRSRRRGRRHPRGRRPRPGCARRDPQPAFAPPETTGDAIATVAAGVGAVIVPMSLARLHQRRDAASVPLRDGPLSQVALAWRTDRTTPLVEAFVGIVRGRTANSSARADRG